MQIGNNDRTWGAVQQALHWFIVVAVISQLTVGLIFANLPENDPRAGTLFGVHATLGLVIFLVMLTPFVWRQVNPVPALPDTLKPYEKRIALANHWAFYALIIGLPIAGYLIVNADGFAVPRTVSLCRSSVSSCRSWCRRTSHWRMRSFSCTRAARSC